MSQPSQMARFFGYAIMAVGALIAFLSGACTLVFLSMSLGGNNGGLAAAGLDLAVGLPFVLVGIFLLLGGRALSWTRDMQEPPDEA